MMNSLFFRSTVSLCAAALLLASTAACRKNPVRPAEGPMERAGEKLDNAIDGK